MLRHCTNGTYSVLSHATSTSCLRGMASMAADVKSGVAVSCSAWTSLSEAATHIQITSKLADPAKKGRVLDLDAVNPHSPPKFLAEALLFPSDFHPAMKSRCDSAHILNTEEMAALVSDLGLVPSAPILISDMMGCMPSARLWWALRAHGFGGASILQGSKVALWAAQGDSLSTAAPRIPSAAEQQAADEALTHAPIALSGDWAAPLAEVQAAARGEGATKSTILDVRSLPEFTGEDVRGGNPVGGHIPGSRHIPHEEFLAPSTNWPAVPMFKTPEAVRGMLASKGFPSPQDAGRVICMCQSGMRAAVPLPSLYALGYDVALFDGSMAEYSADVHSTFA